MTSRIALVLAFLMAAFPASGQDTVNDGIMLLTSDYTQCTAAFAFEHVTIQVLLACPSYPFIKGFEFGLDIDNQVNSQLTATLAEPGVVTDLEDPGPGAFNMIAHFDEPMPAADEMLLANIDVFFGDINPLYFHLRNSVPSSLGDGLPAYYADPGPVTMPLEPLINCNGWNFAINPFDDCCITLAKAAGSFCGPLADENLSWGAVKSLYR